MVEESVFEPRYPAELYTSRPNPKAILSPLYDSTFKGIFTQETEDSKIALRSFLSAVLERKISIVLLKSNEPPTETTKQKRMNFDVTVEFENGEIADIEMQAFKQNYDYSVRAEIMAARLLANNAKKGESWESPKVYQISVLNFHCQNDDKSEVSCYTLKDSSGKELAGKINIIFIDLVSIRKKYGTPIELLTPIEKWGLFLSFIDDEEKYDYLNNIVKSEGGLMAAKKLVKSMSKADDNWYIQNSIYIAECDYNTIQANLKKQIKEEGLKEGVEIGLKKGRKDSSLEIAKNLLKSKLLTPDQIAQNAGLSLEEVLKLQEELAV